MPIWITNSLGFWQISIRSAVESGSTCSLLICGCLYWTQTMKDLLTNSSIANVHGDYLYYMSFTHQNDLHKGIKPSKLTPTHPNTHCSVICFSRSNFKRKKIIIHTKKGTLQIHQLLILCWSILTGWGENVQTDYWCTETSTQKKKKKKNQISWWCKIWHMCWKEQDLWWSDVLLQYYYYL